MVGGTTSGYSLIGNRNIAIKPTRKITMESTPAKIGRRIKKCEKFIGWGFEQEGTERTEVEFFILCLLCYLLLSFCSTPRDVQFVFLRDFGLRRHRHSGTNALQTVHDD